MSIRPEPPCSYFDVFPLLECTALSVTGGIVHYDTEPSIPNGTAATYSCIDGYELVGEENRTCLVDGTWTGTEPLCIGCCLSLVQDMQCLQLVRSLVHTIPVQSHWKCYVQCVCIASNSK